MYCPSYGSGGLYPDNTPNKFKVRLPGPIDLLSYDYEVAIAEITTPRHLHKVDYHTYYVITFAERDNSDKGIKEFTFGNVKVYDVEQLVAILNASLGSETRVTFRKGEGCSHVEITAHAGVALFLPSKTARLLGYEDATLFNGVEPLEDDTEEAHSAVETWAATFTSTLLARVRKNPTNEMKEGSSKMGFRNLKFTNVQGGHLQAPMPPIINDGIPNIFVYTSIIEPVKFGSQLAAVLRICPYEPPNENNLNATVTIQFNKLYYLPINTSRLDEIEFVLATDVGELVNFADKGKTIILLHVRPKPQ